MPCPSLGTKFGLVQNFLEYRIVASRSTSRLVIYPMLQIKFNSISNMGRQKIKIVRSLRYSGYSTNTSCFCLRDLMTNEKSFFPKKNRHVTIQDFKKQKI